MVGVMRGKRVRIWATRNHRKKIDSVRDTLTNRRVDGHHL